MVMRFGEGGEDVVPNACEDGQLRVAPTAILHEGARLPAAVVGREQVEVAGLVVEATKKSRGNLVVLRSQLVFIGGIGRQIDAVSCQVEAVCTDCGCALHVTRLPANQAKACLDVVVALGPAERTGVLERVVDVLQRNIGAVANITEGANGNRRQGVGEGAEGGHACGEAYFLIDIRAVVKRKGEIVDASVAGAEIQQEGWGKCMRETQGPLLRCVGCGAVEVVSAAADLDTIHRSKVWRREGINLVVGEAREELVVIVEPMIDPSVVGVVVLSFVWADGEVVG